MGRTSKHLTPLLRERRHKTKTMTLQQAKDEVAKKWGLPDYESLRKQGRPTGNMIEFFEQVAELYCMEEKKRIWREAVDKVQHILRNGRGADINYKAWLNAELEKLKELNR